MKHIAAGDLRPNTIIVQGQANNPMRGISNGGQAHKDYKLHSTGRALTAAIVNCRGHGDSCQRARFHHCFPKKVPIGSIHCHNEGRIRQINQVCTAMQGSDDKNVAFNGWRAPAYTLYPGIALHLPCPLDVPCHKPPLSRLFYKKPRAMYI